VHFVGREAELICLCEGLVPSRVITLCGPGGIGKNTLASQAIWRLEEEGELRRRFPDGVVWHPFYRQPQAAVALEAIARASGEEPRPTTADAALRAFEGRQALLFLDGAEECDDLAAVLAVRGRCGVLVTTQDRSNALGTREDVLPLPEDEAIALLRAWATGVPVEEEAAGRICAAIGSLPLAVMLAGSYLGATGEDPDQYADWVERAPLAALHTGPHHHQSVRVLLDRSVGRVAKAAQDALCVVGCLAPSPFDAPIVAAALDLPEEEARRALNELALYGLLTRVEARYAVTHRLVHRYASERCPPPAALDRLASFGTDLAERLVPQGSGGFGALDPDRAHLMQVIRALYVHEMWQAVLSLTWALRDYLFYQGHLTELQEALTLGLRGARAISDRGWEANCIRALGDLHLARNEYDLTRQRYEEARSIYAAIGHRLGEAHCIRALGHAHVHVSSDLARLFYEKARSIYAAIGHRLDEAHCVQAVGRVHLNGGEYDLARQRYVEARSIYAAIGHRLGEANSIKSLGDVHSMQGYSDEFEKSGMHLARTEYNLARQRYEEARSIFATIGDRHGEAHCIRALADVHRELAEYDLARQWYEEARPIFAAIGDRRLEVICIHNAGDMLFHLGKYNLARQRYEEARSTKLTASNRSATCTSAWVNTTSRAHSTRRQAPSMPQTTTTSEEPTATNRLAMYIATWANTPRRASATRARAPSTPV